MLDSLDVLKFDLAVDKGRLRERERERVEDSVRSPFRKVHRCYYDFDPENELNPKTEINQP